jgi:folate-dependent phosphoribosylglycinamide formyltransferase PurN
MKWIAFFSQTGSEIYHVSKLLGRFPDRIITNRSIATFEKVSEGLKTEYKGNWVIIPRKPTLQDYVNGIGGSISVMENTIITLHGYLRIMPPTLCDIYRQMYNGHPGDIIKYPELKGFNPQEKAFNLKLPTSGSVIHQVTAGVDEGPVVAQNPVSIEGLTLDEVYKTLHSNSVNLWYNFLKEKLA